MHAHGPCVCLCCFSSHHHPPPNPAPTTEILPQSLWSLSLRQPLERSSHGSELPHTLGFKQSPRGDQEHEHERHATTGTLQAHQVHVGHYPGVWLRTLWAVGHGATQDLLGQVGPQVHQETCEDTHLHQEEEKGAEQHPGHQEESDSQEGLSPSPVHNKPFQKQTTPPKQKQITSRDLKGYLKIISLY